MRGGACAQGEENRAFEMVKRGVSSEADVAPLILSGLYELIM